MGKTQRAPALPQPGQGKRGEEGHLGYLLRQAAHAYRNRVDHALSGLGVTSPQFLVLTMLAAYPGLSGADLARLALLTPQTVSVIIANLERAGWVARRPHAVHGRVQVVEITPTGQAALATARTRMLALEAALLRDLPPADAPAIRRFLVRVALPDGAGGPEAAACQTKS